jgi:hypothetical protein
MGKKNSNNNNSVFIQFLQLPQQHTHSHKHTYTHTHTHTHIYIYTRRQEPGGGIDESYGNSVGEEIGGEASGMEDWRDVLRERFGGGCGDQARLSGAVIAGDHNSHAGSAAGAAGVSD